MPGLCCVCDAQNPRETRASRRFNGTQGKTNHGRISTMAEYEVMLSHHFAGAVRPLHETNCIAQQLAQYWAVICTPESLLVIHKSYKLGWTSLGRGATDGGGAADQFCSLGNAHLRQRKAGTGDTDSLLKADST